MTGLATVVHAAALDEVGCHNREKPNGFVPSPRQRVAGSAVDLTLASAASANFFARMANPKRHYNPIFAVIPSVLTFANALAARRIRDVRTGSNDIALVKAGAAISPAQPRKIIGSAADRLSLIMR
jgi:hypothetical protein